MSDLVKNGKSAAKEWETLVDILHLECVATSSLRVPERFKSAIHLFLRRPHLLNKRVSGARPMDADGDVPQVDFKQLLSKLNDVLPDISMHVVQCVDYPDASRIMYFWRNWILVTRQGSEISDIVVEGPTWFLFLPLQASESLAKSRPQVPYVLSAQEKFKETWEIKLHLPVINEEADTGSDWLKSVLFPKLVQWASEESNDSTGSQASLRLIDLPVYCQHYNRIKRDFVPWIRENWNLSTDPLKHITEDAGISSYLLTLWKNPSTSLCHTSGSSPIRFVDVGCGNGLLTYLLNQHPAICLGFGIDLRARATWKSLDPSGDLLRVS
ncbi:unnamed protein product [Cyprideis torosa]|uniref:tRNA (uracil-O(2)-)-methyltransferase n=1 Tax=Cyprideis torosa TaxID=163714 RepID=A0A7R8WRH3_9CRUS|nr:unnamed protein product [Cyprideis torosa]CAG0906987.1 unnamed protein product [Cyprideis torosa]